MPEQFPLDCREQFDKRIVWAVRMVGVNLLDHAWSSGRRNGHRIRFTFHGSAEMAKGVLSDLIEDEFNGTNARFFSVRNTPGECYVTFDEGWFSRE